MILIIRIDEPHENQDLEKKSKKLKDWIELSSKTITNMPAASG